MGKTVKKMNGLGWMSLVGAVIAASTIALPQAAKADVTLYEGSDDIPSVLAYVRIDGGLRVVGNVDSAQYKNNPALRGKTTTLVEAAGNDWGTSMGGVYGQMKISNDLSGVYKIEAGWNSVNNSSIGWNRRAYAGLSSKTFGTLTAGRDMTLSNDYVWALDPMGMENFSVATLVGGRNWNSAPDQIRYTSPTWGGFMFAGQAQFTNGDSTNSFRTVSGGWAGYAQYQISVVTLGALYDTAQDANGHYTNLFSSSKQFTGGAVIDLKPVTVYAGYTNLQAPDAKRSNIAGGATQLWGNGNAAFNQGNGANPLLYAAQYASSENMEWIGAAANVTPKLTVRGAVYHASFNGDVGSATLYTVGMEYHFTKSFFYYATVGEVTNSKQADFAANIGTQSPQPGKDQASGFTGFSLSF